MVQTGLSSGALGVNAPSASFGGSSRVGHATDRLLGMLAIGALVYAAVRSVEAYGLWRAQEWAQWFALLSTALYLRPELCWLLSHPTWLKCGVLNTNIAVLLFMLILRVRAVRHKQNRLERIA